MAVVWEQYAPNDYSQSLDDALDNLHEWSRGGRKSAKLPELKTAATALTAPPQVDQALSLPVSLLKVVPPIPPPLPYSGTSLSDATSTCSPFASRENRPETGWVVSPITSLTLAYSGIPLVGTTSTCSSFLSLPKTLGPRRGGPLKFPAMPESIVPGSTLEAPSC